jgi:TPR repeat protein
MRRVGALILFSLIGCHRAAPHEAPTKIDVAGAMITCSTAEECDRQCEAGDRSSCMFAGRFYEYGHGVAVDAAHAYRSYERSCKLGYPGGCYNEALLLEAGRGVSRDSGRAKELFRWTCWAGSSTACARAEQLADGSPVGR